MVLTRSATKKLSINKSVEIELQQSKSKKQYQLSKLNQLKNEMKHLIKSTIESRIKTLSDKLDKIEQDLNKLKNESTVEKECLIGNIQNKPTLNANDKYRRKPRHDQILHYLGGLMDI